MRRHSISQRPAANLQVLEHRNVLKSISLIALMLLSTIASVNFFAIDASASTTDQDGDGLTYGLEYLINSYPNDPDSDNDGLPDGWEWKYGLDPLSSANDDGAVGDPDGDGMSNLQEYTYLMPSGWDNPATPNLLDNGIWWNGTVPVSNWNEEGSIQYLRPGCGDVGPDGNANTILCDEDPVGNICANGFDDDQDGLVDSADPDGDGDADCLSDDDDGDGLIDEDVNGWDTDGDGMPDGWEAANGLNATSASNFDGPNGDPDGDGLTNLLEYVNPTWNTMCGSVPCFRPGPDGNPTETTSPCDPVSGVGPGGCATYTAEVDGITSTNPQRADSDNDGLNDSYEALTLLTDPTASDTDNDGIPDGVEVNGLYGNPAQASDPRDNNTDDDQLDDGEEDNNSNGVVDPGETDPTRKEDSGDADQDGIQNWEENLSCTLWDVADSDYGGVSDGDELNVTHGTDPCDSFVNFETSITNWNSAAALLSVQDISGFNPNGGEAWYNQSGSLSAFTYLRISGQDLVGVSLGPSPGVSEVVNRNGSFCHTEAIAAGTISTTQNYCDDDFEDTDGDGLADWEEILGVYGWFSNPSLVDTDADGVSDFDEVFDFTDPNEPCNNLLDDDGDTLNNYFEETTGCDLIWIGIGNGSVDAWVTNPQVFDTDSGGVDDRTEYTDGTNPESNPLDDVLPEDFDGDGIPDAIENLTGTDWTNPDTDGGGMLDGDECPVAFWGTLCANAPYDPFDPTDDIVEDGIVFWANNTTGNVDLSQVHRWRLNTNDFYTGSTYAGLQDVHPYSPLVPNVDNLSQLPDGSFSNGTLDWEITYKEAIGLGNLPVSSYYRNITFWSDPAGTLQRSNDTHNINVASGEISRINLRQEEYFFDWDSLAANTVVSQGYDYQLIVPETFTDSQSLEYSVNQTVDNLIQNSPSTDAYSVAQSISDFLRNGNDTQEFSLFHTPIDNPNGLDITYYVLDSGFGQCKDYNTAFVTMARLAGLPARYVSGYVGGQWNGVGYTVSTQDYSSWGEVKLSFDSGSGLIDLGWVPFDSCPQSENLTFLNQTILSLEVDRDLNDRFDFSGQFVFADNSTPIADYDLAAYLVPLINPQIELSEDLFVGDIITDSEGNFTFSDTLSVSINPGVYSLLIRHAAFELISESAIIFDSWINVTDDSVITHEFPLSIGAPVVGAGSTTTIQGQLSYENAPEDYSFDRGESSIYLSFISSFNGSNNISGLVTPSGSWSINLELDETESLGLVSAELWFEGWAEEFDPVIATTEFHLRPSNLTISLDIREAPNLTATIEGPLANGSIFIVNQDVWVNGTAKSLGLAPIDMEGQLVLAMRENGSFSSWSEIFNVTVNGTFAIQQQLTAQLANFGAGEVEVRLRFIPVSISATDDANLSIGVPYRLQSFLQFAFESTSQLRGYDGIFGMTATDHRGETVRSTSGDYDFFLDNSWFNTTSNLSGQTQKIVPIDANFAAGDYALSVSYNGSDDYAPSTGSGFLRIKAEIGWTINISQEWTHLGNNLSINGSIFDAIYLTPITGDNISQYSIVLVGEDGRNTDLAQGLVDNLTSTFSENITIPTTLPSNAYDVEIRFDFYSQQPEGGPYYASEEPIFDPLTESLSALPTPTVLVGIESEFVVQLAAEREITTLTNNDIELSAIVTDIADSSFLADVTVEFFFDFNGTNVSMGSSQTDLNGTANLTWNAAGIAPGAYEILILVADDLTDPLAKGNSRHTGNSTAVNITVQANTDFRIDSIPATIIAGVDFNVVGQVIDADDNNRVLIDSVKLRANWLNNENETLVSSFTTTTNGSFNMSVPTDTQNNGTLRGAKTLVISVIEGSSKFYLESSTEAPVFVFGVTQFESIQPLNAIVVNRGDSVNITARLVESSNLFQSLSGYDVDYEFRGSSIGTVTTDGEGFANITHTIPFSQPLGLTNVKISFGGSSDLIGTESNFSTINVRSLTFIVVDDITANPVAGELFNISGQIISDNGSGLEQIDGTVLPANILFEINGESLGFTVTGGVVGVDGFWNASILLSPGFAAGNNSLSATYIPAVNFYLGSNATSLFDSRGYSEIRFIDPALDSQGQPSLNDRVERGDNVDIALLLLDNTGEPISGQLITITLNGTDITAVITTAENGTAYGSLTTPANMSVGQKDVNAVYTGISGTTGLLGSEADSSFVVLAQTEITIDESPDSLVAGDYLTVNGTLLDDLGQSLVILDIPSPAVVHLLIDGDSVASIETDPVTGQFSLGYPLPEEISAGEHLITVEFYGGRDWVDPIGVGEPSNPEYYLPSSANVPFNISVPTKITLITPGGDVNREEVMTIEGILLDLVDNPLPGLTIEVWLDGDFMTNVQTDENGVFTAVYPVPADAALGPVLLEIKFNGSSFYLPSYTNGTWNIFSHIVLSVDIAETVAVGQNVTITGTVADNQLNPIANHQVELIVEGITITLLTTDQNGEFSYVWTVSDLFEFGNRTITAYSGSQGYYRSNSTNTTFFLAHRADLTVSFDSASQVTRGELWELSGRLFDIDSLTNEGLENEVVEIYLDGNLVATTQTTTNGEWDAIIFATQDLTRGLHEIEIVFQGTYSHIGTDEMLIGYVWADVQISIDPSSTNVAIRSDGTFGPITLLGSISEVGGTGEIFENLALNIGNGSDCASQREGARCIPSSMVSVDWSNGNFTINTVAPSWYGVGEQYIHIDVLENTTLYLNSGTISRQIYIKLNVDFEWEIAEIDESGNKEVFGSITIIANDTQQGVPEVSVIYVLKNESQSELTNRLTVVTNPSGVAEFEFNSDPPYGDYERWGYVYVDAIINDPVISENSRDQFNLLNSNEAFNPKYKFDAEEVDVPTWAYVLLVLVAILIGVGTVLYLRRANNELLQDAAEVFAYTAELLAAGDSIREAIFNCYQNLCTVLQQNGFLRRDFETVREFEVAIRQAMPQISDDALLALDNMFEMARYSRDEMGAQHQQAAQLALEKMIQEIANLGAIPNR